MASAATTIPPQDRQQADLHYLRSALDGVRAALGASVEAAASAVETPGLADSGLESREHPGVVATDPDSPLALARLCRSFGLTGFEQNLLLLCAGAHLDTEFSRLCARANGDPQRPLPTFDLALRIFHAAHWVPFTAHSTLRAWSLVELDDPVRPNVSPLRISESVLNFLAGHPAGDPDLAPVLRTVSDGAELVPSHQTLAAEIQDVLAHTTADTLPAVIQLTGVAPEARRAIGRRALRELGLGLCSVDVRLLPQDVQALHQLYRKLERESILTACGYLFEVEDQAAEEKTSLRSLAYLLQRLTAPCLVATDRLPALFDRAVIKVEIKRPTYAEQKWLYPGLPTNEML